jgi:hypothetical protein
MLKVRYGIRLCCAVHYQISSTFIFSVVEPKLFVPDSDLTFQRVPGIRIRFLKSYGSGFGSGPNFLLFLQNYDVKGFKCHFKT